MSKEKVLEVVDSIAFLRRVCQRFPIKWIYYPGCGKDTTLTEAFPKNKIVYFDWTKHVSSMSSHGNLVLGDYQKAPFPDQVFDAVFIQDPDIETDEELSDILRTLRLDGILIHCTLRDCGAFPHTRLHYFRRIPCLAEEDLDFFNRDYTVFRKTSTDNTLPEITEEEQSQRPPLLEKALLTHYHRGDRDSPFSIWV